MGAAIVIAVAVVLGIVIRWYLVKSPRIDPDHPARVRCSRVIGVVLVLCGIGLGATGFGLRSDGGGLGVLIFFVVLGLALVLWGVAMVPWMANRWVEVDLGKVTVSDSFRRTRTIGLSDIVSSRRSRFNSARLYVEDRHGTVLMINTQMSPVNADVFRR